MNDGGGESFRLCVCDVCVRVCARDEFVVGKVVAGERRRRRRRARAVSLAVGVQDGKTVIATLPCTTGRRDAALHGRPQSGNAATVSFRILNIFYSLTRRSFVGG